MKKISERRFNWLLSKPHIYKRGGRWYYNSAKAKEAPGVSASLQNNVRAYTFCAQRNQEAPRK